jgi:hypothetical protein
MNNATNQQISIEVNLPNHDAELKNIEGYIEQLKQRHKVGKNDQRMLSLKDYERLQYLTIKTLELLGELSMPAFNVRDELHDKYVLSYKSSPELARKLWLDHYERIHTKYNTLKNRCFKLLDDLEESINKITKKK